MKKVKSLEVRLNDKQLSIAFLTKLRATIYRRAKMLFKTEIFNTAQSLSIDSTNLYHGSKLNILEWLEKSPASSVPSPSSAIIIELSPIL